MVGATGNAGQANYCAAKAGVVGFTKALAREVGARGITANTVAPGYVETDMTRDLPAAQKEALVKSIPLNRPGAPEEIAAAGIPDDGLSAPEHERSVRATLDVLASHLETSSDA